MTDTERPFAYMLESAFQDKIEEYINVREPDSEAIDTHKEREIIDRLKLTEGSTASEVRKRANEIKIEFHHFRAGSGNGNYEHVAHDLFFVLGRTHDVYDLEDVLLFLFTSSNLEQVRHEHELFHNIKATNES